LKNRIARQFLMGKWLQNPAIEKGSLGAFRVNEDRQKELFDRSNWLSFAIFAGW